MRKHCHSSGVASIADACQTPRWSLVNGGAQIRQAYKQALGKAVCGSVVCRAATSKRHASVDKRLPVRQQKFNFSHVGFVRNLALTQRPFSFGGFLGQDMTGMRFSEYNFSGTGFPEPFCCSSVCFNFWHLKYYLPYYLHVQKISHPIRER